MLLKATTTLLLGAAALTQGFVIPNWRGTVVAKPTAAFKPVAAFPASNARWVAR